ncbi:hypothetical protein AgCh_020187 [Apium graveolens]
MGRRVEHRHPSLGYQLPLVSTLNCENVGGGWESNLSSPVSLSSDTILTSTESICANMYKLTKLKLHGFDVKPPLGFQGFPCLKCLNLSAGPFTLQAIENLISGCPLLEKFVCTNAADTLALTVHAPNLKHLTLNGFFTNLYLEHTPLLVVLSIDFFGRDWKSNVLKKVPVTCDCLKFIELQGLSYDKMNNVFGVLYLILQSPNLQELQIEASSFDDKAANLDFWKNECPSNFTLKHLKRVKMSRVSDGNCMEFLKFVLGCSPVLEVMSVSPWENCIEKMNMANEVLHFRRASPKVDIRFFD